MDCSNKNILLLAPKFYNYEMEIKKALESTGANIVMVNSEPTPAFSTLAEVCLKVGLPKSFFSNLFRAKLKRQIRNKFDYIIVIDGWLINGELSNYLRCNCLKDGGTMLLYYWDCLEGNEEDVGRWHWFDKVVTFDRYDYMAHKDHLEFLPLFYCNQFWKKSDASAMYDLYVIGSFRLNRLHFVNKLLNNNKQLNIGSYLYIPKWQFYIHKLFRKKYKQVKKGDLKYKKLSMIEVQELYARCKAIIDIPAKKQKGLTIRTIEALAMHKKIITTNKDIVNYDFYNPNDIFICENENCMTLPAPEWFNAPFAIPDTIIKTYSIDQWINNLLSV